jgi:pimeloyl-ACP methyl ester carboxylesterase
LAPSPTVLPIISPQPSDVFVGRSDPTAAALAAEGHPSLDPSEVLNPTQASIPITVIAADGTILYADYYGAPIRPAPAILVLPGEESDLSPLQTLANNLQAGGYHVMLLYQRGHSPSGGRVDWSVSDNDALSALTTLETLPDVQSMIVLAQGQSTVGAVIACRQQPRCGRIILLDPLPNDALLALSDIATLIGTLPLVSIIGEEYLQSSEMVQTLTATGQTNITMQTYSGAAWLPDQLVPFLLEWLAQHPSLN